MNALSIDQFAIDDELALDTNRNEINYEWLVLPRIVTGASGSAQHFERAPSEGFCGRGKQRHDPEAKRAVSLAPQASVISSILSGSGARWVSDSDSQARHVPAVIVHRLSLQSNTLSIVYCVRAKSPYGETDARRFAFAATAVLDGGIILACEIREALGSCTELVRWIFASSPSPRKQRYFFISPSYAKCIFVICKLSVDYRYDMHMTAGNV